MFKVMVIGAGKIGSAVVKMLGYVGGYAVTVADKDEAAIKRLEHTPGVTLFKMGGVDLVKHAMKGMDAVISACPFEMNPSIAMDALEAGISYFDLTEDVEVSKFIKKIAVSAKPGQIFMPQCGLAPGFIGIMASDMIKRFTSVDSLKLRVGALPRFPSGRLKYNLTWSTPGLVNEYCNLCECISNGKRIDVPALEGTESLTLDGEEYECFNTSGGLGALCDKHEGKVQTLNYKTIRYPGHRDAMDFLINDLRLRDNRKLLIDLLEGALPYTMSDVVLVHVSVCGMLYGKWTERAETKKIYGRVYVDGCHWTAIQLTTAAGVCGAVDSHLRCRLGTGFVGSDEVDMDDFKRGAFGGVYNSV